MMQRPRRNRKDPTVRSWVRETHLDPSQLIYPLFIVDAASAKNEIGALQGQYQLGLLDLLQEIESCMELGVKGFVLFPAVKEAYKDAKGTYGYADDNFYLRYIRTIKAQFPEAILMSDVALDPYSSDGHDGFVQNGKIINDYTLELLGKMALAQAQAGIDIIGPSDMMDGRVGYIRQKLDAADFTEVSIMAYTAKYASAFYGPFREALDSAPKSGDKKTYQMDPANSLEALREAALDEDEGADFLMVKPALCYLDVIQSLSQHSTLPIAAYNVSGEYAMIKAAAQHGWLNEQAAMVESLMSIRRAGARVILSYWAKQYATLVKEGYAYH